MKKTAILLMLLTSSPLHAMTASEFFENDRSGIWVVQERGAKAAPRFVKRSANTRGVNSKLIAFANRFGCTIISGYRPGARIRGSGRLSNHARGLAIDARGCKHGAIKYALNNGMGVGTYSRCSGHSHVHFSLVPRERYHKGCRGAHKRR